MGYVQKYQNGQEQEFAHGVVLPESKGTNQRYGLHSSASSSVHSASVTVLGLLKKKESVQNGIFAIFRLAT